eukprot:m.16609 g.16609  ORF g.16609 m.16609 type:complete len:129 (+) comp9033_c0_seq1:194-580(+)
MCRSASFFSFFETILFSGRLICTTLTLASLHWSSTAMQVTTMAELDSELSRSMPFTQTESGIDLKLLTSVLSPPALIQEQDAEWTFQHLFTEVKSELETEREKKEAQAQPESRADVADEASAAGFSSL